MSTHFLALQNVSLARNAMPETFVKNKNSLTAVREAIENCPELFEGLHDTPINSCESEIYGNEDQGKFSEAGIACF